tara:strand:+ start:211 stop:588 length:378 start_codon:yes stop_codon:yes gene_type:complete
MVKELSDKHKRAINAGRVAAGYPKIKWKKKTTSKKKTTTKKAPKNSQWKNKSLTMPMKNGKPYKKGDKPPFTYKKYNYKVKISKTAGGGKTVQLQKEPPKDHIREMIAAWSMFEVKTPKNRYTVD